VYIIYTLSNLKLEHTHYEALADTLCRWFHLGTPRTLPSARRNNIISLHSLATRVVAFVRRPPICRYHTQHGKRETVISTPALILLLPDMARMTDHSNAFGDDCQLASRRIGEDAAAESESALRSLHSFLNTEARTEARPGSQGKPGDGVRRLVNEITGIDLHLSALAALN
jgi:hypothetical protein